MSVLNQIADLLGFCGEFQLKLKLCPENIIRGKKAANIDILLTIAIQSQSN